MFNKLYKFVQLVHVYTLLPATYRHITVTVTVTTPMKSETKPVTDSNAVVTDNGDISESATENDDLIYSAKMVVKARDKILEALINNHSMVNYGFDGKLLLIPPDYDDIDGATETNAADEIEELTTDIAVNQIKRKLKDKEMIIDGIKMYIIVPDKNTPDSADTEIDGDDLSNLSDLSDLSNSERELILRVHGGGSVQFRNKVTIVLSGLEGYTTELKFKLFTTFVCHVPGIRNTQDMPIVMDLIIRYLNSYSDILGFTVDTPPQSCKCMIKRSESKTGLSNLMLQDIYSFLINTGREAASHILYEPIRGRGLTVYDTKVFPDEMRDKYMSKTDLYRVTTKLHTTGAFSIKGVFKKKERYKIWEKAALDLALFIFSSAEPSRDEIKSIVRTIQTLDH